MEQTTSDRHAATVRFVATLFGFTEQDIYFSSLANTRDDPNEPAVERRLVTRDIDALTKFVERYDRKGRGLFFCVSTMDGKRSKATAREIAFAFADLDLRGIDAPEAEVRQALAKLRCQPTLIVWSGHGLHLYWLLNEPMAVQGNIERIEAALRQLADLVAGDLAVCEVARLMRLPGSHNTKQGEWLDVRVERFDGPRYELDDLEDWLAEASPILRRRAVPKASSGQRASQDTPENPFLAAALAQGFKPPVDVEQRLAGMSYGGPGDSSIHQTQLSVSASLLRAGRPIEEVIAILMDATHNAAADLGERWNWAKEEKAIRAMCDSWLVKHPQKPAKPAEEAESEPHHPAATPEAENAHRSDGGGAAEPDTEVNNVTDFSKAKAKKKAQNRARSGVTPPHIVVAEALLAVIAQRGEQLMFTDKGAYRYEDRRWRLETDADMAGWLNTQIEACARALSMDSANRLVNEARAYIIRSPELRREEVPWDMHGCVPTRSGLVNPRDGRHYPATPEQFSTWQTVCDYDPAAECPTWLEMLGDAFSDRTPEETVEYVALLQEVAGAGLIDVRSKALSKALVLWGPQDTGKSGILDVIAGLFGTASNTTALEALNTTHGTVEFIERRPWVLHEAFEQSVWHLSSNVKSIISGDPFQINVKRGPMLSRRFRAPILWATNHAPQFKEATKAIVERMIIVQCRRTFLQSSPVGAALKARNLGFDSPAALVLASEPEGVLAWAVTGLIRCLKRGYFVLPAEAIEAAHEVRLDSNIVAEFMEKEGCVDYSPNTMISTADFNAAFASWWLEHKGEDRGIPSGDRIGKALRAMGDRRVAADRSELRDSSRRYYAGIKLNEEGLRHWKNTVTTDAFAFQGRKASTTDATGSPTREIPQDWAGKWSIQAMRAAYREDVTRQKPSGHGQPGSVIDPVTGDHSEREWSPVVTTPQPTDGPRKPRWR